jgi:hypothetical protein
MKKLLYGLLFISSAALMAMDTEESDSVETADSSSFINDNENFASSESFEFSLDSENNDSIEEPAPLEELQNSPYLFINPTHVLIKSKNALDELNTDVDSTKALEGKVDAYLNGKTKAETLYPIDSRAHITPVLDRLLVCNNPRKEAAIKAIVLHTPRECYHCPVERLEQAIEREGYCQTFIMESPSLNSLLMFLTKLTMPSTLALASNIDKGMKLGITGYLIAKLPYSPHIQDEIFKRVISLTLNELILRNKNTKKLFQNGLQELTINDLLNLNSNVMLHSLLANATLPRYNKAVAQAKTEWIESLKKVRATFDREEGIYLLHAPSKKQRAFDKIVKPMVAEILPTHQIGYIPGFDE